MLLRLPMAIETETHRKWLFMPDDLHLVDPSMTFDAGNTTCYVHGVVEVNVIGEDVDIHPRNRITRLIADTHRFEQRTVRLDDAVAVHAGLRRGDVGMSRLLDVAMTKTAIDTQLSRVQRVAEGNRLNGSIPHPRVLWRGVIGGGSRHDTTQDKQINDYL